MTQLLLIRHAHNDWVDHRLAGWTPGVQLNERGHAEARALADRLANYALDAVYASPLERARQTAEYLATPRGLAVQDLADVGEVRYGQWTGQALQDLRQEPLWQGVQRSPSLIRFPDGESLAEVQTRAVNALESLRGLHPDGVVAVVSHGDVIRVVVAYYAGVHLDMFQRLTVATASLTVLRWTEHGPRLLLFNDTGTVPPPPAPAAPPPQE